jgi:uncharacterized coiled-coil DUF342 family protein
MDAYTINMNTQKALVELGEQKAKKEAMASENKAYIKELRNKLNKAISFDINNIVYKYNTNEMKDLYEHYNVLIEASIYQKTRIEKLKKERLESNITCDNLISQCDEYIRDATRNEKKIKAKNSIINKFKYDHTIQLTQVIVKHNNEIAKHINIRRKNWYIICILTIVMVIMLIY